MNSKILKKNTYFIKESKFILYHFLETKGKIIGLDITYFFGSSFFSLIQQSVGLVLGLYASYIFGHFVSKSLFGEYNLILSILSFFTFISLPGIDTALTQSSARGFDGSLKKALIVRFFSSLAGVPILLALSLYYLSRHQSTVGLGLMASLPLFPFFYSSQSFIAFLYGKRRFDLVALFSILSSAAYVILITLAIFVSPSTLTFTLAYMASFIIPAILGIITTKKTEVKTKKIDRQLIPYGFFLTLNSSFSWITGNIGNILLANFLGVEQLAIFVVASKLPASLQKSYASLSKSITAKIAGQSKKDHFKTITRHWWKFILLGIGMFSSLWIIAPFVLIFLFPTGYEKAVNYAQLLSIVFIPMPLSWALADVIIFQKNKKYQTLINTVPNLIKIAAYFFILPIWKIPGLILITIIDSYLNFLLYLMIFYRSKQNMVKFTHAEK